jgi:8-oxo-dGTP diphosphatase
VTSRPEVIGAAGGVVYRRRPNGKAEYLVVHRPRYDDWSLPKGKLDPGESYEACAEREVMEETGFTVKLREEIGTIAYTTPGNNPKRVRYWLMSQLDGAFVTNGEVDDVAWLRPRKARAALSYGRDRAVFDRAVQLVRRPASGRVYLVRHALAGDRAQWKGSDKKRPLSKRGRTQAAAITDALSGFPVTDIWSSRWIRCHDTVAPLAHLLDLPVQHHGALVEGAAAAGPRDVERLVSSLAGSTAVLCTHGDVIAAFVEKLVRAGVSLDGPVQWKKGSIWVLETRKGKVAAGHYLPSPS